MSRKENWIESIRCHAVECVNVVDVKVWLDVIFAYKLRHQDTGIEG